MTGIPNYKVNGIKRFGQEDITWKQLVISLMKQFKKIYKRAGRRIKKRRFKKYRFVADQ